MWPRMKFILRRTCQERIKTIVKHRRSGDSHHLRYNTNIRRKNASMKVHSRQTFQEHLNIKLATEQNLRSGHNADNFRAGKS